MNGSRMSGKEIENAKDRKHWLNLDYVTNAN